MLVTLRPNIDQARAAAERLARDGGRRCRRTWTSCARSTRTGNAATFGSVDWAHPRRCVYEYADGPTVPAGRAGTIYGREFPRTGLGAW